MHKLLSIFVLMIYGFLNALTVNAASWNEATQGDLSNNGLSPNTLVLEIGTNAVTGSFGLLGSSDRDYIAITVPTGAELSSILFGNGFATFDGRSFIGVQAGSTMTVLPNASTASGLLGYAHVDSFSAVGADYLPEIGNGFGSIGFSGPLSAGTYTFWIQETSSRPGTFSWDFVVSTAPVPEPETNAMLLIGLGVLACMERRKRK